MSITGKVVGACALALGLCAGSDGVLAQQHFLFGGWPGKGATVAQFEAEINHTISVDDQFQRFTDMPSEVVEEDVQAGRTPLISWNSNLVGGGSALATDILAGKYDSQFDAQADAIGALGGTILVEWQPEMTGNPRNALFFAGVPPAQWGPTYVSVWQHIHDIFVSRNVTNVQWVWSPAGLAYKFNKKQGQIPCQAYFPGANYVDWMGLHSYPQVPVAYDQDQEILYFYQEAPILAPGKPLIQSQTGATRLNNAQSEWISTAEADLQTEFPLIRGFVYFNADTNGEWALGGTGLTAFQTMAADPYFQ